MMLMGGNLSLIASGRIFLCSHASAHAKSSCSHWIQLYSSSSTVGPPPQKFLGRLRAQPPGPRLVSCFGRLGHLHPGRDERVAPALPWRPEHAERRLLVGADVGLADAFDGARVVDGRERARGASGPAAHRRLRAARARRLRHRLEGHRTVREAARRGVEEVLQRVRELVRQPADVSGDLVPPQAAGPHQHHPAAARDPRQARPRHLPRLRVHGDRARPARFSNARASLARSIIRPRPRRTSTRSSARTCSRTSTTSTSSTSSSRRSSTSTRPASSTATSSPRTCRRPGVASLPPTSVCRETRRPIPVVGCSTPTPT